MGNIVGNGKKNYRWVEMRKNKNYGVKVWIKYNEKFPFKNKEDILRNVTEIHYNFKPIDEFSGKRIAFESDIHQTGLVRKVEQIDEFETSLEFRKEKEF